MSHRDSQVFQSDGHPLYIFQLHFNVAFLPEMEPGLVDSPSKRAQNTKDTDWSTSESMKKLDVELSELTELTSIEARWGVGDVFWSVFLTLRPFGPNQDYHQAAVALRSCVSRRQKTGNNGLGRPTCLRGEMEKQLEKRVPHVSAVYPYRNR